MANPRGQQRDKPFRDALRMAIAEASGDPKRLRRIAESLLNEAESGDVAAIREVADRLDGKVPQAIVGDDDHPPVGGGALTDEDRARALAEFIARTKANDE